MRRRAVRKAVSRLKYSGWFEDPPMAKSEPWVGHPDVVTLIPHLAMRPPDMGHPVPCWHPGLWGHPVSVGYADLWL